MNTIKWIGGGIGTRYKILGIKVLARNFFRPMYGVQDFAGRIISLVARSLILVWRLGIMVVWAAGGLFLLIAWIGGPLLAIYQLVWGYKV